MNADAPFFAYRDDALHVEQVPLATIAAIVGTPFYVYSRAHLEARWRAFDAAFGGHPHLICYAVKANANLAVLDTLARLGSGFDIVSAGELERVLLAGGDPAKTVFSGVGKTAPEMRRALEVGIHCFNVESEPELRLLDHVARELGARAPVSLRVNPDVDARTHPYISTGLKDNKFGIPIARAQAVYAEAQALPHIDVVGIDCHIGSQLTDLAPFADALARVLALARDLRDAGIALRHLDLGGGLGVRYRDEHATTPQDYVGALLRELARHGRPVAELPIVLEPGRAIVANAGALVTRVQYLKRGEGKDFAIVDAGMNDLVRPALYEAWQEIVPVQRRTQAMRRYDVVGPVCESADFLGLARDLAVDEGDLLAVLSAGAYGFSMSSNYNARPRPAEVMVDGGKFFVVRARETHEQLWAGETRLP